MSPLFRIIAVVVEHVAGSWLFLSPNTPMQFFRPLTWLLRPPGEPLIVPVNGHSAVLMCCEWQDAVLWKLFFCLANHTAYAGCPERISESGEPKASKLWLNSTWRRCRRIFGSLRSSPQLSSRFLARSGAWVLTSISYQRTPPSQDYTICETGVLSVWLRNRVGLVFECDQGTNIHGFGTWSIYHANFLLL